MANTIPQAGRWLVAAIGAGLVQAAATAETFEAPVASRNLSPVAMNLGVPVLRSGAGFDGGRRTLAASLHWASHSLRERTGGEYLEFDGETQRVDVALRAGLGWGLTLDINLPWLRHSGGSLDSLIDGWHGFWGLPDGARDDQPRDRLLFAHQGAGEFRLDDSASGIGDAEFALAKTVAAGSGWALSAFAHLKIDSGSADDFTGSEATSLGGGLRFSARRCLVEALTCHLQAGLVDVGDLRYGTVADARVPFAGLSLALRLPGDLALLAQLDAHDNPYRSAVLGDPGAVLWGTLGLRWQPTRRWRVEGAFSEDLAVGSAPDITFLLNLAREF
jgi:hypothetical protein